MRGEILAVGLLVVGCGGSGTTGGTGGGTSAASSSASSGGGEGGAGGGATVSSTSSSTVSSASSSSVSSSGVGGAEPECEIADDCGDMPNYCSSRTCIDGVCGVKATAAGEIVVAHQKPNDCADVVCDGSGAEKSVPNAADEPIVTEACHVGKCAPGPVSTLVNVGTACATGLCDSSGACVAHIPVKCFAGGLLYTGCDGKTHTFEYQGIVVYPGGQPYTCNTSVTTEATYCAPGSECTVYTNNGQIVTGKCQ